MNVKLTRVDGWSKFYVNGVDVSSLTGKVMVEVAANRATVVTMIVPHAKQNLEIELDKVGLCVVTDIVDKKIDELARQIAGNLYKPEECTEDAIRRMIRENLSLAPEPANKEPS